MYHKLSVSGELSQVSDVPNTDRAKRKVLLCYVGEFESMDGPVVVTEEKLKRLVQNYNAILAQAKETSEGGQVPDKFAAPLQLDHSDSAKETVGRNYDELTLAPYTKLDGSTVTGLYSDTTFIGEDNVKKGFDGTWAHVSIGADFENGIFQELTITPFPAAPEASLLKRGTGDKLSKDSKDGDNTMSKKMKCLKYLMEKKELSKEKAEEEYQKLMDGDDSEKKIDEMCGKFDKMSEGEDDDKKKLAAGDVTKMSEEDKKELKKLADGGDDEAKEKLSRLSEAEEEKKKELAAGDVTKMSEEDKGMLKKLSAFLSKLTGGKPEEGGEDAKLSAEEEKKKEELSASEDENTSKMSASDAKKAYMKKLMDEKDMSEDEAKDKMGKMSDEDIAKAIEKHKEEEHKPSKMSAGNGGGVRLSKDKSSKIAKLASDFRAKKKTVSLSARKAKITHRLSLLRSGAKISPAEVKKINIDDLAGKSQETVDAVFKSYEERQPVIDTGIFGTSKAMDMTQLSKEVQNSGLVRLEAETLESMPHLKKMKANADKKAGKKKEDSKITQFSAVGHMDRLASAKANADIPLALIKDEEIDKLQNNFENMLKEGKIDDVKQLMGKAFGDIKRLRSAGGSEFANQEERMNNIEESLEGLSESFESFFEIVEPLLEK